MTNSLPETFGRFRVTAEIGQGAMGVVYRAVDPTLERVVAIKTITLEGTEQERAHFEARFLQEARAAGGLSHPCIVTIYDFGREGDMAFMAMELLEGRELRDLIREGAIPAPEAVEIAARVAEALSFAHERGVVHRDVKPGNIMVLADGRVKIMDFGIARLDEPGVTTATGLLLGSPRYMAPEQVARPLEALGRGALEVPRESALLDGHHDPGRDRGDAHEREEQAGKDVEPESPHAVSRCRPGAGPP